MKNNKNLNILITGGTGFVGGHLTKKLESLGHNVYISNTKNYNLYQIKNLYGLNPVAFDYIFHLAAATKAGEYCLTHMGDQWVNNQILNTNILTYWKNHQRQAKMISIGTSASYPVELEMREGNYLIGSPEKDLFTYAMTKRMLLIGQMALGQQYGLKWLHFVPSTIYGPGFPEHDHHMIIDLIRKIYNGKHHGSDVELWGDGYQRRELMYIDDAIESILGLLEEEAQIFNLGSSNDLPIRHFAEEISDLIGYDHNKIFYNTEKYVGVRKRKLEVDKIQQLLLNYCGTSLRDGLSKTIEFYHNNYGKPKGA